MEWYNVVLIVFAVIIVGLYLYKRISGKDLQKILVMSKPTLIAQETVADTLYAVFPNQTIKAIGLMLNAGIEATEMAEQAWKLGELQRDERNAYAKKWAKDTQETLGIEVTSQIECVIAGVIEMTCMVLPHESHEQATNIDE